MTTVRRGGRRPGPKLPIARMERAVELKMLQFTWGQIEQVTKTPYNTLMRWQRTDEWKALEAEWRAADPLARRAKAVLAKALSHELFKKGPPDTSLAERILGVRGNETRNRVSSRSARGVRDRWRGHG